MSVFNGLVHISREKGRFLRCLRTIFSIWFTLWQTDSYSFYEKGSPFPVITNLNHFYPVAERA